MADKDALHAAIMNLPCDPPSLMPHPSDYGSYRMGHRDARHAAAELVSGVAPQEVRMLTRAELESVSASIDPSGAVTPWVDALQIKFAEVNGLSIKEKAVKPATEQETIPPRVYWAPLADNFYDADGKGQGTEFYVKWKPRRAEFPQGESFGWGKGSAHNPFKDPPRESAATDKEMPK